MAIDTAAKRKSAIGIALHALRTGVIADGGGLDAPQRLHAQGLYSGIAASGEVSVWSVVGAQSGGWTGSPADAEIWTVLPPATGGWA